MRRQQKFSSRGQGKQHSRNPHEAIIIAEETPSGVSLPKTYAPPPLRAIPSMQQVTPGSANEVSERSNIAPRDQIDRRQVQEHEVEAYFVRFSPLGTVHLAN